MLILLLFVFIYVFLYTVLLVSSVITVKPHHFVLVYECISLTCMSYLAKHVPEIFTRKC